VQGSLTQPRVTYRSASGDLKLEASTPEASRQGWQSRPRPAGTRRAGLVAGGGVDKAGPAPKATWVKPKMAASVSLPA
jgi:hypothetical protein